MASGAQSNRLSLATWTLRIFLGIVFAYVATTKITGTGNTVNWFEAIGWGQWFRFATGAVDLVGAVLLFVPRWTCYGAMALTGSVGLGTILSLTVLHGNPTWGSPVMVTVPLVLTSLAALLAWITFPTRAAAD